MSYTHIFISQLEAQYFNKEGVTASELGRTPDQFQAAFDIVHAGIESNICTILNRGSLTSTIIGGTDYTHMKNVCKQVASMAIGNWFVWLKHLKMNKVVIADGMQAMISEVPIFTKEMTSMLMPFRRRVFAAVDPDASYEHVLDESDDTDVPNDEGDADVRLISDTREDGEDTY